MRKATPAVLTAVMAVLVVSATPAAHAMARSWVSSTAGDPVIFVHGWVLGYGPTPWDTLKGYLAKSGWVCNDTTLQRTKEALSR